jgi:hypothetical protein
VLLIKAIDTVYNGYKFRSRLEARWAVFFDSLSINYEYEKEGFDLDGTWYLPDFWLPNLNCWVEIKPNILRLRRNFRDKEEYKEPKRELTLCRKLSDGTDKVVLLIGGKPWARNYNTDNNSTPYYSFEYEVIVFFPKSVMMAKNFNNALRVTGFNLHLEDKGYYDLLDQEFYTSNKENTLYWFIRERYKDCPTFFELPCPKRGDVYGLIEADRKYYLSKFNELHPKWKYDLTTDKFVFSYKYDKLSLTDELYGRDFQGEKLLEAYNKARQERF